MYSDTQHENMILNITSSVVAFLLGCISAIMHTENNFIALDLSSFFTNTDNYIFLFKSIFSGVVALGVKVYGDLLIQKIKAKKRKEE